MRSWGCRRQHGFQFHERGGVAGGPSLPELRPGLPGGCGCCARRRSQAAEREAAFQALVEQLRRDGERLRQREDGDRGRERQRQRDDDRDRGRELER